MNINILEILRNYFSAQPVEKAWVFGSMSRNEDMPDSDIDILVKFDKNEKVGLFKHSSMIRELKSLLSRDVDLVTDGTLLPWVVNSVDGDKILIYEREAKR